MAMDDTYNDSYGVQMKTGGGGSTAARSGRQRGGAKVGAFKTSANAPTQRAVRVIDNRRRTNAVTGARAALNTTTGGRLGGRTPRSRTTTRGL